MRKQLLQLWAELKVRHETVIKQIEETDSAIAMKFYAVLADEISGMMNAINKILTDNP